MDPICVRSTNHTDTDRIAIASLTGAAQRLAYPLYRGWDTYNQQAAIAELHKHSDNPHLLAHATAPTGHYLYDAIRQLLLAAGAKETHLDAIADDHATRSLIPHP